MAETERCYLDIVARATAAPLNERFGGPDASFSHAVGTTVTPHASAGSGAVELLLTSPSGAELVLAHTNGAWSTRPAASDIADSDLARVFATLATTDTQSAITWANALLTARFPSHGSVTDIANGVQWTAPTSTDPAVAARTTPTVVRIRAWPEKTGELDLYDTLIDFTNVSGTDDATLEITRELRPLVGRTSFGRILHVRHADGRTEERHVHVLRCFDTDVAIDFTIDARDPAARADAELIASSLRLATQPTAPGRLIQGNLVALVVPWHAAPFIDIYDATAEQIDVTLDADTTISLAIGPDTDEQRALHSLDLTFLFGADPTGGTPTTLPILGLDRPGELFTTLSGATDLALSRHRFTAPPHTLQFLAFYATTAAHTANDAQVRAIAATIQLR
jgi:hypothetical protein